MGSVSESVAGYFEMWNEEDSTCRDIVIGRVWSPDAVSSDPMASVRGAQEISNMVEDVQKNFPGHRFHQVGETVEHHDRILFRWQMKSPAGEVKLTGLDCVRVDADARFSDLTGFFNVDPA